MTHTFLRSILLLTGLGILAGCATSTTSFSAPATSLGRMDLVSGRAHASMKFYQDAFGWDAARKGAEGYWEVTSASGQSIGGVISLPKLGDQAGWLTTVDVPNLDETLAKVTEHGGEVTHGPVAVYGNIRTAVVTDPEGAKMQLRESDASGNSGPWVWFELVTENVAGTADWYAKVLGFTTRPMEGTERVELLYKEEPVAGVSPNLFQGEPNQWIPVLGVSNLETQLKAILDNGGQVLTMSETEGKKIALVADPQNAPFLIQQTEEVQP